jgi:predicted nucleic acid-binding protein
LETKVKYLIDTNIWLERLLDQDKSDIVSQFLDTVPLNQIFLSDFTLHSIGVILSKFNKLDILHKFINDLFFNGLIEQIFLDPHDFADIISNIDKYKLDFDDAYQLTLSQKYDLTIITFDKDFNAKGINKKTPEDILKKL